MFRVFKETVGWSEAIFIIDSKITFKEIVNNPQTNFLSEDNYVGVFNFDQKFLDIFYKKQISGKNYYYLYSYRNKEGNEFTEIKNEPKFEKVHVDVVKVNIKGDKSALFDD